MFITMLGPCGVDGDSLNKTNLNFRTQRKMYNNKIRLKKKSFIRKCAAKIPLKRDWQVWSKSDKINFWSACLLVYRGDQIKRADLHIQE
jgi:hypothetical protein